MANDIISPQKRQRQCHSSTTYKHRCCPFDTSRPPWSLLLTLLLLLSTNNNINNNNNWIPTAIFNSSSGIQLATAKSTLQGFIYWDANSNGIVDTGELFTGVVDTTIQLRSCAGGSSKLSIIEAEAISTWHPQNPGEKYAGHNEIYPNGGYYKFDIEDSCLLSDGDLTNSNGGGCFLVIQSLENYQITSSFPLRHLNYNERNFNSGSSGGGGRGLQVFDWIPYHDVMPTNSTSSTTSSSTASGGQSSSSIINHGYHARTQQCFGYHPTNRRWYIFPSTTATTGSATTTTTIAAPLATPNEQQYNYDTLIYGPNGNTNEVDVYDTTLSVTPVGMSENGWPLELRVSTDVTVVDDTSNDSSNNGSSNNKGGGHHDNGGLILGLKLDNDRTTGDYVSLSDVGNLNEGKGASGKRDGEARFEFVSKDADDEFVSALTYFKDKGGDEDDLSGGGSNGGLAITLNTDGAEYDRDDNINGILENPRVMIDVIQSFLLERGNLNSLEGGALELAGLTVVLLNQWSLVTVVDKSQNKQQDQGSSISLTGDLTMLTGEDDSRGVGEVKKSLRGSLSSKRGSSNEESTSASSYNRLLRGGHPQQQHSSPSHHRNMIALPEPHLVFEFAVYAKYREKVTPNQDAIALQVTSNFGNIVSNTCNVKRETLIARIRQRSGYFQGCNPKAQSGNNQNGDGSVTYTAFGGEEKDYVEINIGVVNRFDCDKLLPLYYFELKSLAVRPIVDYSEGSLSRQGEVLSNALQLLQVDDGYYKVQDVLAAGSSPMTAIVVSVSIVVSILFVATVAAVWYVRRERRKLREERERRRKAREAKLAAKEARKQRKHDRNIKKEDRGKKQRVAPATLEKEERIPVKEDASNLGNDLGGDKKPSEKEGLKHEPDDDDSDVDSELGRLFDKPEPDLHSRDEDAQPVRKTRRRKKEAGGGSESDSDPNASSRSQRRKQRRRKKKADGGSETDSKTTDHSASNISGMNYTASSKDDHQSTDKTPATRSHSSHHESDPISGKADADEDSEPPIRIEVSERGTLQKGISDISLGLAASLKKSFTKAAATLKDLQEDGSDSEKEDHSRKQKSDEHEATDSSHKDKKEALTRTRSRRRRTLTKAMSSFRKSSTESKVDDGEDTGRRRGSRPAISKVMSSFRKPANEDGEANSPGRKAPTRGTRMLSQVGMSVRNLVIGELSSSDDDSSSDSDSSSDGDSSSSSDSSADVKRRRTARRVISRRASTESKSRKETPSADTSGQRKSSKRGHGDKRKSMDSEEMSKTNEYLPNKLGTKFDDESAAAVALPESPSTEFSRVDDSSCAAVATLKPPSERSLGPRTKSSISNSDSHAAIATMRLPSERSLGSRTKSSKSNSDSHRADVGSKRSGRHSGDSHGHRERRKNNKSSRHHSSKNNHKKKGKEDEDNASRKLERQGSRKAMDNLRSSFKRSLSVSGSIKGKKLSDAAISALESEEDTKDSKRESKHSSKSKSTRKHRHREDSDRGSHRNKHHRQDDSERGDKGSDRNSERNAERRKRQSRRKYSDEFSDRETDRASSHKGRTHKSSPHRTKTKSSSSKHTSHKKSSRDGDKVRRRRATENAN
ncbi:hypothetical protein QTG54_011601 [Skeletonema marinoi]|uniref:Uncharacterized protein n=1 Tax=Skeletonema marinoi TaxID=267567 RepID=A0AAD8Y1D6_9STRA|nr:hypothetical protein QTG54_011601 [Skeletonema marinoi]